MEIITQMPDEINRYRKKWDEKKLLSIKMAAKMIRCGLRKRGMRMAECAETVLFRHCDDCGRVSVHRAQLCRDKLCPVCSWRLARQRYGAMLQILRYIANGDGGEGEKFWFMTLTVPNVDMIHLGATLDAMAAAWNRLLQRVSVKDSVLGWARAVEITYNQKTRQAHPHYHVILVTLDARDKMWQQKIISDWLACYRGEGTPSIKAQDIRAVYSKDVLCDDAQTKAILETFKYTQKSSDLLEMPGKILYEYAAQTARRRMIAFGGILKDAKAALHVADMEEVADERDTSACTYCGSKAVHDMLCGWCGVSYEPVL